MIAGLSLILEELVKGLLYLVIMVILLFTIFHHFSDVSYGSRYTLDDVVQSMKKTGVGLKGRTAS